jgi:hypothetical protein
MKHPPKITCDICTVEKKDTNNWIMWQEGTESKHIIFRPWDNERFREQAEGTSGHVCGQDCAAKLLMRITEGWK